jgi:hypothetical protein
VSAPARHEDRRSLLFMNYIHARLFKRSLLVLSVKVAFTLLLPWIRRHEDFYRFTRILCSCTLLPSYAKMPTLLPYPHPMRNYLLRGTCVVLYIVQYMNLECSGAVYTRALSGPPSTGAAIAMDGGVAPTQPAITQAVALAGPP